MLDLVLALGTRLRRDVLPQVVTALGAIAVPSLTSRPDFIGVAVHGIASVDEYRLAITPADRHPLVATTDSDELLGAEQRANSADR